MKFGKLITALLLVTATCAILAQDAKNIETSPLKALSIPTLEWPGRVDREALVRLDFCVARDGKATNIRVSDGGFYEQRFVNEAIRVLQASQFIPATVDGRPVMRCAGMPFRFLIVNQDNGISEGFRAELKKVEALIDKQDYAGANFHAQWMLSEKVKLQFEYAMLQATLAQTYARVGQDYDALAAVRRATAPTASRISSFTPGAPIKKDSFSNYLMPEPILLPMLRLRFALAASLGLYVDALEAYSLLAGLSVLAPDDPYVQSADKLTRLIQSDKPLVAKARITNDGYWYHLLSRPTFMVQGMKVGALQSVELFCSNGNTAVLEFKPDEKWQVPDDWSKCYATFKGQAGTEFLIVESVPAQPGQGASP